MNDLFSQWRIAASSSGTGTPSFQVPVNQTINQTTTSNNPNYEQVMEMIDHSLGSLKVYVLESEITQTQNTVKSIVSQATF